MFSGYLRGEEWQRTYLKAGKCGRSSIVQRLFLWSANVFNDENGGNVEK